MAQTEANSKKEAGRYLRVILWLLLAIVLVVTATTSAVLFGLGHWLVKEDSLKPSTAIAVLSGNIPSRALEAAWLYRDGYAKEIWLTHPGVPTDSLKELGIQYPSEDDLNVRVLRREGVPAKAIHVMDTPINNTAEELEVLSTALQSRGGQRMIVVTNKAHTRRVHLLWNKYFATRGQLIVHAVSDDDYQADRWWRTTGGVNEVVHEVMGIANVWTGLQIHAAPPVQPAYASGATTPGPEHTAPEHSATD
jgi:hypothetical protein